MRVEIVGYDSLPSSVNKAEVSDNGDGKEYASYLLLWDGDLLIRCESDAMEREDASFCRDLRWIKDALENAYQIGRRAILESVRNLE